MEALEEQVAAFRRCFTALKQEIGKVFVGQTQIVEELLVCLFCQGHALLEGLPGLGKTLLVSTLSQTLALKFVRIQCTPDLMPADIIGSNILVEAERGKTAFRFQKGPLFANIVLADEINRATPKTQSAFLEAMQERNVTVFGTAYRLEQPFLILATQNPVEMEGTYTLPEAQLDRFFFKLTIQLPDLETLSTIMDLTTTDHIPCVKAICTREQFLQMSALVKRVKIAEDVKRYAIRLMLATHPEGHETIPMVKQVVRHGASPRAAQSMILGAKVKALANGRYNASFDDLREVAMPALQHRIMMHYDAEIANISPASVVKDILRDLTP